MVDELDITDQDVTKIADMIDGEIATLVPEWKRELALEENQHCSSTSVCQKCDSNGSFLDYVTSDSSGAKNLQILQCSKHGCTAIHGRFEEITYQVEGSSEQCLTEGAPEPSCHSDGIHYADIWAQRDGPELCSQGSRDIYCDEADRPLNLSNCGKEEKIIIMDNQSESSARNFSSSANHDSSPASLDDYENEIRQELRWLKAKYQMQLRGLRDQQLRVKQKPASLAQNSDNSEHNEDNNGGSMSLVSPQLIKENKRPPPKYSSSARHFGSTFLVDAENKCANLDNQNIQNLEELKGSCSPDQIFTAKNFYTGTLLPQPLHRATSLPVDAIDA